MWLKFTQNGDLPIAARVYDQILSAARTAHPNEMCGLLLGQAGRITEARETPNVHPDPDRHFEIDPQALIDAHREEREGGPQVLGYFHSHPSGEPSPSETDKAMSAKDGKVWAIAAGENLRFWQDNPDGFHALSYEVVGR